MSQPKKWWWGLIPLALLWIVSNMVLDGRIETDLASRALKAAGTAVHEPGVAVSGRDVSISGMIFSPEQAAAVEKAADAEWGVRKVAADLKLLPEAKPFAWNLALDGDAVVLAGAVPNPAVRQAIVDAAKAAFPDRDIRDEMNYASGAAAGFAEAVTLGIGQTAGLEGPSLSLSDGGVTIAGKADSIAVRDAIVTALGALPDGFSVAGMEIEAPEPYGFNALLAEGALTLSGSIPGEDLRGSILDAARRLFVRTEVVDQLQVAGDAPADFGNAILAGLSALSRLADGTFNLTGTDATLSGQALYQGALDAIRSALSGALPGGFTASFDDLAIRPAGTAFDAAACQVEVNSILESSTILFDTGSARISGDSAGLLDRIVGTFARCPESDVEVAGHTDSTGNFEANVTLSQQRAEAVVAYLTGAGLASDNFTATGHGPAQPVASNDTEEGRAQNRRIEFIVR